MRSCPSFDITLSAKGFFFDLARTTLGDMFELQDRAAKYAIVLGNYKLAVLWVRRIFKILDLILFHQSSSLRSRLHRLSFAHP